MTPEERIKRYATDPNTLPLEERARNEAAQKKIRDQVARGDFATPKPGDNFPVGLEDEFKPFPLSKRPGDTDDQEPCQS